MMCLVGWIVLQHEEETPVRVFSETATHESLEFIAIIGNNTTE